MPKDLSKPTVNNEDEFGIITDDNHKFSSIEAAGNYVTGLKDKLKRKASMEEFPITTAFPEQRLKYLRYCVSLMTKKNLPFVETTRLRRCRAVTALMVEGYTIPAILGWLKKNGFSAKLEDIGKVQKEGMMMIKDAITHVKNTKTPILGG